MIIEWITTHAILIGSSIMIVFAGRGLYIKYVQYLQYVQAVKYLQAVEQEIRQRSGRAFSSIDQYLIVLEMLDIIDSEQIPLQVVLADAGWFDKVLEWAIARLVQRGAIEDRRHR